MAYNYSGVDITLKSTGVSSKQYFGVFASSSVAAGGFAVVATRGGKFVGVLQDNSTEATGLAVRVSGVTKMAAGDSSGMDTAIIQGTVLSLSSVGQAVPSTGGTGEWKLGQALEPLATGSTGIIAVLLMPFQSSS